MLLSTLGLAALAYGLIRAGQVASFSPISVWATTLAGIGLLAAFILVELRIKEPSFNPRLFRQARFAGGNLALGLLFLRSTAPASTGLSTSRAHAASRRCRRV
jgi:hypothetical protein